jgi:hypothetical protein
MEGGVGVIDVGETAVVHVGEAALPGPVYFLRRVVAPQSGENVQCMGPMARDTKGYAYALCASKTSSLPFTLVFMTTDSDV